MSPAAYGRQAAPGVPQHPGGQIDARRCPAELADEGRVHARAAADLQAGAPPLTQQFAQHPLQAQRVASGEELLLVPVGDLVISGLHLSKRP
jgi:hypothetical protein